MKHHAITYIIVYCFFIGFMGQIPAFAPPASSGKAKRSLRHIKSAISKTKKEIKRLSSKETQRQSRIQSLQSASKSLQKKAGVLAERLTVLHDSTAELQNRALQLSSQEKIVRKTIFTLARAYPLPYMQANIMAYNPRYTAQKKAITAHISALDNQRKKIHSHYDSVKAETEKLDSLAGTNEIELYLTTDQQSRLEQAIAENSRQLTAVQKNRELLEKELQKKIQSAQKIVAFIRQSAAKERSQRQQSHNRRSDASMKQSSTLAPRSTFMYPLPSRSLLRRYGSYKNESSGVILQNPGIDFKAKPGTRVVSSAEGIVSLVYNLSGYNTVIIVEHSQGIRTVYGNLFRTYVRKGDNVQKGQPLGITGETIDGAYLHFEVWRGSNNVNPLGLLR